MTDSPFDKNLTLAQGCITRDFAFAVPEDWVDRTVSVWSAPADSATVPANLVVAQDQLRPGEALGEYANRQLAELVRSTRNFGLKLRREIAFAESPAVEIIFNFDAATGTMQQRQVFVGLEEGRVCSIGVTSPAARFEDDDVTFRAILAGFRRSR